MVLKNVCLALGYFLGAVAGDFAAVSPNGSSPIWPAAGVALAALYLYGNKVLPGILLGALSGQFYSLEDTSSLEKVADSLWMGAIVGTGSTVQAWFGNWLLKINRMTSSDPLIDDEKILRFFFYGAFLGTTVSPTLGTATLLIKGVIVPANSLFTWITWWVGDCMGVLVFAPVMLALFEKPRYYWRQRARAILLSNLVVIGLTFILFSYSKNWDRAQITERFNHGVTELHHQLMAHLNDITVDNTIMKAFFDNSKVVQREEFYAFAAALSLRHPYMQALEWIPRVDLASREAFEKKGFR